MDTDKQKPISKKQAEREAKALAREAKRLEWIREHESQLEELRKQMKRGNALDWWGCPYQELVDLRIEMIRNGSSISREYYSQYVMSDEESRGLADYRIGDTFYRFPGDAPCDNILDAAIDTFGTQERMYRRFSHRCCHISFVDNDLIIREERPSVWGRISEFDEVFSEVYKVTPMDRDKARVYVCPFDDLFYITEDIKFESARLSHDLTKWFVLPCNEKCSTDVLQYGFTEYMKLAFSYKSFRTDTEESVYNFLEENATYNFSDVGYELGYAESTIKTTIRNLEKYGAIEVIKQGGTFVVQKLLGKDMDTENFVRDYTAMTERNLAYLNSDASELRRSIAQQAGSSACVVQKKTVQVRKEIPSSFVSIDFETLYSQRVSACSVGMVKYIDDKIVDRYYTLIKPPKDYPGKCGVPLTWVHGITEGMLVNERTFVDILPEMESFAADLPLVAHNACVERACILDTARFYGIKTTLDCDHIIDTYPLSELVEKTLGIHESGRGTHSLDAVCRRFNVPEMNHHNALDDAEMCGNLLIAFKNALGGDFIEVSREVTQYKAQSKYNAEDKVQRTDLENVDDNPFKDCGVVLTGFSTSLSQEYGHRLKEMGAKVCTGVSGKTKWLICGPNAGPSKMEKAKEIGAQIISEQEFLTILSNFENK